MTSIFEYTDYRVFLREWFEEAKKVREALSYRYIARKLEIDPGFLVRIFQGNKHISEAHLPALIQVLKLPKRESLFFERLVLFCKAKGEREIAERFQSLMEIRENKVREMNSKQYRYYQHWYIPAIRCLLAAIEFRGDYQALARAVYPPISNQEALEAVRVLESLQMIKKNRAGVWEPLDQHISAGDAWTNRTIHEFQQQTMELGIHAHKELTKESREISTLTFAIPKDEFSTIQDMVREFRTKIARFTLGQSDADSVYHMNIQVFPMTQPHLDTPE